MVWFARLGAELALPARPLITSLGNPKPQPRPALVQTGERSVIVVGGVWISRTIELPALRRGLHLVTAEIVGAMPEIAGLSAGLLHAQILHTSAALTLNENADPSVGIDLATWLDEIAPEEAAYWTHTLEGPDDMPAHAKAALLGASVSVPIAAGLPQLGTWQGIHLCELRDHAGPRRIVLTLAGE